MPTQGPGCGHNEDTSLQPPFQCLFCADCGGLAISFVFLRGDTVIFVDVHVVIISGVSGHA